MKVKACSAAFGIVLGLAATCSANSYPYTLTVLDLRINNAEININGQIAGTTVIGSHNRAVLWEGGSATNLGVLPGATDSHGHGLNDAGQVVGKSRGAFLWDSGTMVNLGTLTDRDWAIALGINNTSQVVGYSYGGTGPEEAFLWQGGAMNGLGTLGGTESAAVAVNDVGQVAGKAQIASGEYHPFLWESGVMMDLGVLQGGSGNPKGMNDAGLVVGQGRNADGDTHALLWDHGAIVDLGLLPGNSLSYASAINSSNEIVGQSYGGGNDRATLWQGGQPYDLNALIADPDWHLVRATAINELGEIVGIAVGPDDERRTFLLRPTSAPLPVIPDANGPYAINVGDDLALDGGGSTPAPGNTITSYKWDLDDDGLWETDAGSQAVYTVGYSHLESLGLGLGGPYGIHLLVTDSGGSSAIDDAELTVVPEPATLTLGLMGLCSLGWYLRKRLTR